MEEQVNELTTEQLPPEEAKRQLVEAMKEMAKRDPKQYKKLLHQMNPNLVHFDEVPLTNPALNRKQRRALKKKGLL